MSSTCGELMCESVVELRSCQRIESTKKSNGQAYSSTPRLLSNTGNARNRRESLIGVAFVPLMIFAGLMILIETTTTELNEELNAILDVNPMPEIVMPGLRISPELPATAQ